MKKALIVSTEVQTRMIVDIPINPKGSEGCQIEDYIEKHYSEIADKAKDRLFTNMQSDWKENVFIKTDEEYPIVEGRTYADTQIYKEWNKDVRNRPTADEWEIIKKHLKIDAGYKYYADNANKYFAISFSKHNQAEDEEWGMKLVDMLNELGHGDWFLGDINEEYVFVN